MTESGSAQAPRRGVEHLALTQMLRRLGARVPVDEATVSIALSPFDPGPVETPEERERLLGSVLRTGTAFVLNAADVPGSGSDVMDLAWEPWDGLPPLPFPRIWIECAHPTEARAAPFPYTDSPQETWDEGEWSGLFGIGIVGDEDGWTLLQLSDKGEDLYAVSEPWGEDGFEVEVVRIAPDASSHYPLVEDRDDPGVGEDIANAMAAWRAIVLVNMLDVLGVRHVPLDVPRPHRRAHERRFQMAHPSVYFVDLRQAGDKREGKGDREYHHRWLVRGHWRQLEGGRRTWVRPYIKGPAGAPWRGRPIYIDKGSTGQA